MGITKGRKPDGSYLDLQLDALGGLKTAAPAGTASALANVAASLSSVTVLAANAGRKAACVLNDSAAVLYLKLNAGAAAADSFTARLDAGDYYEFPQPAYLGAVTGIWAAADGAARVTEFS